jgi:hypothetical protein
MINYLVKSDGDAGVFSIKSQRWSGNFMTYKRRLLCDDTIFSEIRVKIDIHLAGDKH